MMLWLFTMLFRILLPWVGTTLGSIHFVCYSLFHLFSSSLICCRSACSTSVTVTMSFGGRTWPINPLDFNTGSVPSSENNNNNMCQGAIFDLSLGSNNAQSSGNPDWIIGDTFLVRNLSRCYCCPSYLVPFSRKMCTRCSVPHQRLLGLPNCLLRLVDQVRNPLGQSQVHLYSRQLPLQVRLPRVLLLLLGPLGPLVCALFQWISIHFFLILPPSGAMSTTIPAFLMLSTAFTTVIMLSL